MKFFIDTANLEDIKEAQDLGILDVFNMDDFPRDRKFKDLEFFFT